MDLQYIQFSDALTLTGAEEIPDLKPRSLTLYGNDFRSAIEVYINDQLSPSFAVASKSKIIAQIPPSQVRSIINEIVVS